MKTTKQVIQERPEFKKLINAVIKQLGGTESIQDINNHGIDGGYGKFVYYNDTLAFAHKHRVQINEMLTEQASQLGEEVVSMVASFGVFRRDKMDEEDKRDLYRYLSGVKCKETKIPNLMAWFAAEEVCRMFEND